MTKTRLEAFSDGVIAIIITIMVLELKAPHDTTLDGLAAALPTLLCYLLSFVIVAIYWVNHHHLLHVAHKVDGRILWANMHPLFWLSLVPWVTEYLADNHAAALPVALYGAVSTFGGAAFSLLRSSIARLHMDNPGLCALHRSMAIKNYIALGIYVLSIPMAWVYVPASLALIALPAAMYFMPDSEAERYGGG